jgi:tyrosyl-tRNA synthetase
MPLLEGLDGVDKMSKSKGNYVGITDPPGEMFGKLMSVSDELMWRYFELLSFRPTHEIEALRQGIADGRNPRDVKFELAVEIVDRFHGRGAGERARAEFIARFREGAMPESMAEVAVNCAGGSVKVALLLKEAQLVASTSAGYRMIEQGAVRIDGERVADRDASVEAGGTHILQVGKRGFARVTLARRG